MQLSFIPKWRISIRYILAEINTEIRHEDAFIALQKGLEMGLKRHGFTDRGTFDYVLNLIMNEPERKWFEIKKMT
jgi:hypothetical protein